MSHVVTRSIALTKWTVSVIASAALMGCWGGGGGGPAEEPPPVAVADTVIPITVATVATIAPTATEPAIEVTFNSGFSGNDPVTGATVEIPPVALSFTSAGTPASGTTAAVPPVFKIASGTDTATGDTVFGSCTFVIKTSTFPASSPLAVGKSIRVDPCNISVNTSGTVADGTDKPRTMTVKLGNATSTQAPLVVKISTDGTVTARGVTLGAVTLVPGTGAGG